MASAARAILRIQCLRLNQRLLNKFFIMINPNPADFTLAEMAPLVLVVPITMVRAVTPLQWRDLPA